MTKLAAGTKVKINSRFYEDEQSNYGTGVVERYEPCINGADEECDCGAGGTYYVKVDSTLSERMYIGTELTEV